MNDKFFKIALVVIAIITIGGITIFKSGSVEEPRSGDEHDDQGSSHLREGEYVEYGGEEPPTSGDHSAPVDKGAYTSELPDQNTIHNLEHGYIYVSYKPGLSQEEIEKLERLFFSPFSNAEFSPTKVIMAPRAANESPIILSSWQRSQKFDSFDEQAMMDYYLDNVNKSPEPTAP